MSDVEIYIDELHWYLSAARVEHRRRKRKRESDCYPCGKVEHEEVCACGGDYCEQCCSCDKEETA